MWKHKHTFLLCEAAVHFSSPRQFWVVSDLIQSITTLFKCNGREHPPIHPLGLKALWRTEEQKCWTASQPRLSRHNSAVSRLSWHVPPLITPIFLRGGNGRGAGRQRFAWRTTGTTARSPRLRLPLHSSTRRTPTASATCLARRASGQTTPPTAAWRWSCPTRPARATTTVRGAVTILRCSISLSWLMSSIGGFEVSSHFLWLLYKVFFFFVFLVFPSRVSISTQRPWAAEAEATGLQSGSQWN